MVGGQETTTNLIGNGLLTLLRHPEEMERLRADSALVPSAVEELLRYESPSQHTARLAPADLTLGGKHIRQGQAVIAVMGAANRDPARFPDPDRLDLARTDNRHVAFGWASHFCFGAPLARIEGQIALETLLRRLPGLQPAPVPRHLAPQPGPSRTHRAPGALPAVSMTDLDGLSPAKRELLQRRLQGRGPDGCRHRARLPAGRDRPGAALGHPGAALVHPPARTGAAPRYNEGVTIRKDGAFDPAAFRLAFNELLRRHEIWRTTFELVDGVPAQVVGPPPQLPLPLVDLSDLPYGAAQSRAAELAAADFGRPYDLARGPLVRPHLVRLAADHHRLYLGLHHIVFDGVTLYRVILPELVTLYDDFVAGRPPSLGGAPCPVLRLRRLGARVGRDPGGDRPHGVVAPAPERRAAARAAPRPAAARAPAVPWRYGALHPGTGDRRRAARARPATGRDAVPDPRRRLRGAAAPLLGPGRRHLRHRRRPPAATGAAAPRWGTASRRSCCAPTSGTTRPSSSCWTALPARSSRDSTTSCRSSGWSGSSARLATAGANPIFQVTLVLEPKVETVDTEWSLHLMEVELGNAIGSAKFDLSLECDERPEGHISGRLNYDTDLFSPATARRLARHWHRLLVEVLADPTTPVSRLDLLDADERRQQLEEWNPTDLDPVDTSTVHELVSDRARRAQDSVALVQGDVQLTYGQLDQRADAAGPPAAETGSGPGCHRGGLPRTFTRPGGRAPRDPQDRGRLPSTGSAAAGGPARLHDRGRGCRRRAHPATARLVAAHGRAGCPADR